MVFFQALGKFQADGDGNAISSEEADAFFRLNLYVRGEARERKIARIENQFGEDPELGEAVKTLSKDARRRV